MGKSGRDAGENGGIGRFNRFKKGAKAPFQLVEKAILKVLVKLFQKLVGS